MKRIILFLSNVAESGFWPWVEAVTLVVAMSRTCAFCGARVETPLYSAIDLSALSGCKMTVLVTMSQSSSDMMNLPIQYSPQSCHDTTILSSQWAGGWVVLESYAEYATTGNTRSRDHIVHTIPATYMSVT